jgi:ABC-type transport system substrate-binding protein
VLYGHPVGPSPAPTPKVTNAGASARVAPAAPASGTEPAAVVSGSATRDVLGFSDPAVDALFAQAASELNATAAASLYNEIDTDLWSVLPTLPLFEMPTTVVVRDDLLGVTVANTWAGPLWDAGQWAVQASPPPTTSTTS